MKTKVIITLLCLLFVNLFSFSLKAQSFKWVNHETHNIPFNPDITSFVSATDAQGNSLLGSIYTFKVSFSGYYGDVSLKKFNPSGLLLFSKILYGKVIIEHLKTDEAGNIYLSGTFMDTLKIDSVNFIFNTGSGFNVNSFIIKLNQNGNLVWKKNIEVIYPGFRIDALKIKGNNLFTGIIDFNVAYIKKFDLNGTELMSISQSPVRGLTGIDVDEQGNIYSAGSCGNGNINFAGHIETAQHGYNVYFAKYNSSGSYQWSRFVQDITFSSIDIACDYSGNLYASGNLFGSFFFGNIQTQGNQWVYDFFLTKIDGSGNFLWVREVPNTPTITGDAGKAKVNSIAVDRNNNVYFTGFLRSTVNWGNNVITTSSGYMDLILLKYDQNGIVQWGKRAGGTGGDRCDNISLDNSGNVFLAGNFSSTAFFDSISVAGTGNINSYLAKIQIAGNIDIKVIVEGFYDQSAGNMRMHDTLLIYLRSSSSPYSVIDSSKSVIDQNKFTGSFSIVNAVSNSYYIQTKHRNSLETWSKDPVNYTQSGNINYDFTASASSAFGNNLIKIDNAPDRFAIYSGDISQDGTIDAEDIALADNDAFNFISGYVNTDVTGDNTVDANDLAVVDNNVFNFVSLIRP